MQPDGSSNDLDMLYTTFGPQTAHRRTSLGRSLVTQHLSGIALYMMRTYIQVRLSSSRYHIGVYTTNTSRFFDILYSIQATCVEAGIGGTRVSGHPWEQPLDVADGIVAVASLGNFTFILYTLPIITPCCLGTWSLSVRKTDHARHPP